MVRVQQEDGTRFVTLRSGWAEFTAGLPEQQCRPKTILEVSIKR
jgi:hypothetical protein